MTSQVFNPMEEVLDLFPPMSRRRVQLIIEKAMRRELRRDWRGTRRKLVDRDTRDLIQAAQRHVAGQLTLALSLRGAKPQGAPSARVKAPKGGGRTFHFAHSSVSRGETDRDVGQSGSLSHGPQASDRASPSPKPSRAAAHMRYVERPGAVERGIERAVLNVATSLTVLSEHERDGTGQEMPPLDADGSWDRSRADGGAARVSSAGAGQAYVERSAKLEAGEQVVFSFGTIGDTAEERRDFWEKLEANERKKRARVQERLIVELPHEATGEQRHEMMRSFARQFEVRGLPYWVALHAPGARNDHRNFHAHIVYSSRRARKMLDPNSGSLRWDFEITQVRRTSSRNRQITHPFRQERHPDMRKIDAIPKLRLAFAEAVNQVLVRDDVRDATGTPVRYDARSYKAMGLDVVPMRSVNRIVDDKLRAGKVVRDDGYTREMIQAELRHARDVRDQQFLEVDAIRRRIADWARAPVDRSAVAALPPFLRPKGGTTPAATSIRRAGKELVRALESNYLEQLIDRSAQLTLDRLVEATSPEALARPIVQSDRPATPTPDPDVAAALHAEAEEARRAFEAERKVRDRQLKALVDRAAKAWSAGVSAPTGPREPHTHEERRGWPADRRRASRIWMPPSDERAAADDLGLQPHTTSAAPDASGDPRHSDPRQEAAGPLDPMVAAPRGDVPPVSDRDRGGAWKAAPLARSPGAPHIEPTPISDPRLQPPPVVIIAEGADEPIRTADRGYGEAVGVEPVANAATPTPEKRRGASTAATTVLTELRRRLDAVVSGIRSIQDLEERWAAIERLCTSDGAARAVLAVTPPGDLDIRVAAAVAGRMRSIEADDSVDANIAAASTEAEAGPASPQTEAPLADHHIAEEDEEEEARRADAVRRRRRALMAKKPKNRGGRDR